MRFPFGRSPRRRELEEIQQRISQLREEIGRLELTAEEQPEELEVSDAYRSVQRLRGSMAREELVAKQTELRQLEARASELQSEIESRPSGAFPAFSPEQGATTEDLEPAAEQTDQSLPAERAIIEPAMPEEATDEPTVSLPAEPEAPPAAQEEPAAVAEPPMVAAKEPEPPSSTAEEPEPALPPTGEQIEPEPVAAERVGEEPPRRRVGPLLAAGVAGLLLLGGVGGIAAGVIPLGPPPTPTPSAQSPIALGVTSVLSPTAVPSPTSLPTLPPPTPAPATVAPPTVAPPTPVPTEAPPEIEPEAGFVPNEEPAIATVAILAPPGFTGAWLRTAPSMSAPVYRLLPNGTRVDLLEGSAFGSGFSWRRVRTADGLTGWVVATTLAG